MLQVYGLLISSSHFIQANDILFHEQPQWKSITSYNIEIQRRARLSYHQNDLKVPVAIVKNSRFLFSTLAELTKSREKMISRPIKKTTEITCENNPKGVCSVLITWPLPPQVEHTLILDPNFAPVPVQGSHVSKWESSNSFSVPKIASENSKEKSYLLIFESKVFSIYRKLWSKVQA